MFTIRKCLIEIPNLSAKTKAFLLMTLDLYYSNFSSVGSSLERMYQGFLIEENGAGDRDRNGPPEDEKIPQFFEKLSVSKSKPPNLKLQIKKSDSAKTLPTPPFRGSTGSTPSTPNSRNQAKRDFSAPPSRPTNSRDFSAPPSRPKNTRDFSAPPARPSNSRDRHVNSRDFSAPPARPSNSRQKNASKSPQKANHQNQNATSPKPASRSVSASPQFRSYSASKKLSPQEIRNQNSHPPTGRGEKPSDRAINLSAQNVSSQTFNNDENILRPQNLPSASAPKQKVSSKVYFREENIENLTWNGESAIDGEDPDPSNSPKVNPYSSSFLNFLSSN